MTDIKRRLVRLERALGERQRAAMAGRSAAEIRAKQREISAAVVEAGRIRREEPELLERLRQEEMAKSIGQAAGFDPPPVPMLLRACEE